MNKTFLNEVAASVAKHNWGGLCFIVPNKRSTLYLSQAISSQLSQPTIAPEIFDIDSFVRDLSGLESPPKMELMFTLYDSYCQVVDEKQRDDFITFLGWGETLLSDLDSIDRNLLDKKEVFALLAGLQEVKAWGSDDNDLVKRYLHFWKELPKIHRLFSESLRAKGNGTAGMLYREAVRNLEVFLDTHPTKTFIICGFNALTESESSLFQSILAQNRGEIYWDVDKKFLGNPRELSTQYMLSYKNQWPYYTNKPFLGVHDSFSQHKQIEVIETSGRIAQAKQVGTILSDLAKEDPNWERVAVVLPDEKLLNPTLHALPPQIDKLNITMGQPLKSQPVSVLIEALFDMHINVTKKGFYYKHIEQVLGHQDVRHYCKQHQLSDPAHAIQSLIDGNYRFITGDKLCEMSEAIQAFAFLFSHWTSPKQAAGNICKALKMLLSAASEKDYRQVESLHQFVVLFQQLELQLNTHAFIDQLPTLRAVYNAQIGSQKLSYIGEPLEGLQVMGMLETRLLDFDTVILTQANEGILPAKTVDDSWIPFDIKKHFGLPTRDEKDAIFSYHFFRLMYRAKRIFILYSAHGDSLGGGEVSRFVRQWSYARPASHQLRFYTQKLNVKIPIRVPLTLPKSTAAIARLHGIAEKGLSATSLTNYITDPIRFYNNNLLKISENEEIQESIAYHTLGTVIHDSLEELYKPFVGSFLSIENLEIMQKKLPETLRKHFVAQLGKESHTSGKNLLLFAAAEHNMKRVLQADINDISSGSIIELLGVEEYRKITRSYSGIEHPITFHGIIDRVDRKDGVLRILDYKTGKTERSEVTPNEIADCMADAKYSKAFQLLFYSMLWSAKDSIDKPFQAGIISIKNMGSGTLLLGLGPGRNKRTELLKSDLLAFEESLEKLIRELFDPKTPFTEAN